MVYYAVVRDLGSRETQYMYFSPDKHKALNKLRYFSIGYPEIVYKLKTVTEEFVKEYMSKGDK